MEAGREFQTIPNPGRRAIPRSCQKETSQLQGLR